MGTRTAFSTWCQMQNLCCRHFYYKSNFRCIHKANSLFVRPKLNKTHDPQTWKFTMSSSSQCIDLAKCFSHQSIETPIEAQTAKNHTPQFRSFENNENSFALDYFMSTKEYKSYLCPPELDWYPVPSHPSEGGSLTETSWYQDCKPIVQQFIQSSLTSLKPISDPEYQPMVQTLVDGVKMLSKQEIVKVLYHMSLFPLSPSVKEPTFYSLWKALDEEVCARYNTWDDPYWFRIDYLIFRSRLNRLTNFHWKFMSKLFRHCSKLSKEQFVWFMFCLNIVRKIPSNFSIFEMEHRLLSLANKMTPEEVSIVALGFFKTETRIRDPHLYKTLVDIVTQEPSRLNTIGVAAFSKFVRHSSSIRTTESTAKFQEIFYPEIDRLSVTAATHLILTGTQIQIPHRKSIDKVMELVEKKIDSVRLKELERIALTATMFNLGPTSFYEKLSLELKSPKRTEELHKYGRSLPALLYYLAIKGIFPYDIIEKVLSKDFTSMYYGSGKNIFKYMRELACLDITVEIEAPDYTGPRLPAKLRRDVIKRNMLYIEPLDARNVTPYQKFVRDVSSKVNCLVPGPKYAIVLNTLPQYHSADIILCRNANGNFIQIPREFQDMEPFEVKYIPEKYKSLTFHLLMLCSRGMCVMNTKDVLGQGRLQKRQLEKLGYMVDVVFHNEWEHLTDAEKKKLVKDLLTVKSSENHAD